MLVLERSHRIYIRVLSFIRCVLKHRHLRGDLGQFLRGFLFSLTASERETSGIQLFCRLFIFVLKFVLDFPARYEIST